MRTILIIVTLLITLVTAACDSGSGSTDQPTVVVTTNILGDVVSNVVGEDAEVLVLIPTGADPHDYQPSAQQVATINQADLVVANGLGLEEGMHDVLEAAGADGANVLEVGEFVDPIPFRAAHEDHNEEPGTSGDEPDEDPHFWMDPLRVAEAARAIAAELALVDGSADWVARAEAYGGELVELENEIVQVLASIENRALITNHDSMGYFAARYDFAVVGVVIPGGSTLGRPSSEQLAELVRVISEENVLAIFAETTESSLLAEAVAAETGQEVAVVELYTGSLGDPGSGAETLIGMLRTNAGRIAEALVD